MPPDWSCTNACYYFFRQQLQHSVDIKDLKTNDLFANYSLDLIADENNLARAENYFEPLKYSFDIFPESFGEYSIRDQIKKATKNQTPHTDNNCRRHPPPLLSIVRYIHSKNVGKVICSSQASYGGKWLRTVSYDIGTIQGSHYFQSCGMRGNRERDRSTWI